MTNLEFYLKDILNLALDECMDLGEALETVYQDHTPTQNIQYSTYTKGMLTWYSAKCKEVLTPKEKDYLNNIIKPFRNSITFIEKKSWNNAYEYLKIKTYDTVGSLTFPLFEKNTMYKNMNCDVPYTLEDLGL